MDVRKEIKIYKETKLREVTIQLPTSIPEISGM